MKHYAPRRFFSIDNLVAFFVWAFIMAAVVYYTT
jgi:hypothetical protein